MVDTKMTSCEVVAHAVCLVICLIGFVVITMTLNDNDHVEDSLEKSYIFSFFTGTLLSFLLLVNAGRSLPMLVPLSIALAFYWFPRGISIADVWRYDLEADQHSMPKKDLEALVSGSVLCLFATLLNVIIEIVAPKSSEFKANAPLMVLAVVGALLVLGGDVAVWIHNDRDFVYQYQYYMVIALRALVATVFALDTIFNPDMAVVVTSVFMCTLAGCEALVEGINYGDSSGDLQTTQQGLIATSVGLVFVLAGLILTGASKKNASVAPSG